MVFQGAVVALGGGGASLDLDGRYRPRSEAVAWAEIDGRAGVEEAVAEFEAQLSAAQAMVTYWLVGADAFEAE